MNKDLITEKQIKKLNLIIDAYQAFARWILRREPGIQESQRGKNCLEEIDQREQEYREFEQTELKSMRDEKEGKPAKSARDILTEINAHLTHYWQDERYVRWKDAIKAMEQYADQFQSSPQSQPGRGAEEVLSKYKTPYTTNTFGKIVYDKETVLKAMEEYRTQSNKDMYPKEPLETIEVCEQGEIVVMAKKGKNIIDVGRECIALANQLSLAVKLHFNQKVIRVFKNTEIGEIINSK